MQWAQGFLHINSAEATCNCALFALPLFVITDTKGAVTTVRGVNKPVTNLTETWKPQDLKIDSFSGLLIHSDGLSDAETGNSHIYGENLLLDVAETFFPNELEKRFKKSIKTRDDDMTFIRLSNIPSGINLYQKTITAPSCTAITGIVQEIEECLTKIIPSDIAWVESVILALSETLLNALEHGCLKMGGVKKQQLLANDEYDEAIKVVDTKSSIHITIEKSQLAGKPAVVILVTDSGEGFNVRKMLLCKPTSNDFQGRGKIIISSIVDALAYNQKGNTACLLKYLT